MAGPSGGFYSQFHSQFLAIRNISKWRKSGGALLGLSVLKLFKDPDAIDPTVKTVQTTKFAEQTGWDRLRIMFTEDDYGNVTPELSMVMNGAMMGAFTGSILGGTLLSKDSFVKFMEENQGTAFQNTFEAKKQLQNKVTIGFARGAWMWGWRLGLFCGSFMMLTTSISVYRGKSSILEYIAAGGGTGVLFKLKQGPRAMVAGGVVGGALGTIAGAFNLGIMYLTGTSMEELRYWQYKWKDEAQAKRLEALRKAREEDMTILIRSHEEKFDPNTALIGPTGDNGNTNEN